MKIIEKDFDEVLNLGLDMGQKIERLRTDLMLHLLIEDFCGIAEKLEGEIANELYDVIKGLENITEEEK